MADARFGGEFLAVERLEGGMGYVYLGYSKITGRYQAAKTFKDGALLHADGSVDRALADRFRREAVTWLSLAEHPNVVKADFLLEYEGRPYLFLEYVVGHERRPPTLEAWLDRTREDIPFALDLAVQACAGMEHAVSTIGIVHRDLKPSNIMVARGAVAKITDFGLVKAFDDSGALGDAAMSGSIPATGLGMTQAGSVFGTMPYMAPEQWRDASKADERSDIYSFGAVLHEMLSGSPPFPLPPEFAGAPSAAVAYHLRQAHETLAPEPLSRLNARVSPELERLTLDCLAKESADRPGGFRELGERLRACRGREAGAARPRLRHYWEFWDLGNGFLREGKYREALPCFENLARIDGRIFHAHQGLAQCHMGLGNNDAMRESLDRCIGICPEYAGALNDRGFACHLAGDEEGAIAWYRRALEASEGEANVLNNLGLSLLILGRRDEGRTALDRALELNPAYPDALQNRAWLAEEEGDLAAAAGLMRDSLILRPGNLVMLHKLMKCLSAMGAHEAALRLAAVLDKAMPGNRGTPPIREAALAARNGKPGIDFDLSDIDLEAEVSANPSAGLVFSDNPDRQDPRLLKAISWIEVGRFAEAIAEARRLVERRPADAAGRAVLASALHESGAVGEALAEADRAIALNPEEVLALRVRALCEMEAGDFDSALRDIDAAIGLAKVSSRLDRAAAARERSADLNNKGNMLHKASRFGEAVEAYEAAVRENPRHHLAFENMGICLNDMGRLEDALRAVETAMGINPRSGSAWRARGDILDRSGDCEGALRSLEVAVGLDGTRPDFRLNMGRTLYRMGRLEEARGCFAKALELQPGYDLASRNLAAVEIELAAKKPDGGGSRCPI